MIHQAGANTQDKGVRPGLSLSRSLETPNLRHFYILLIKFIKSC